jgi:hypothetical protein
MDSDGLVKVLDISAQILKFIESSTAFKLTDGTFGNNSIHNLFKNGAARISS